MNSLFCHPRPSSTRRRFWSLAGICSVAAVALLLALPAPALAQFDFADALAVKLRTYPLKREGGKLVPGPDGMPQPEAMRGGRPAGLKELPAFPVDMNFPGGSILDALQHYQKRDPIGAMGPVLAMLQNGYLEMDIEKPCMVDMVKVQFEHQPTKEVPSFKEHGIAALMKIVADGVLAAELQRESQLLRDRYNRGLSTTPEADQNTMAALRVSRMLIAHWYNPRVVAPALAGLKPQEAKERFKAEVAKGKPLEANLVMGPLRLAVRAKVDHKKKSPPPAGCPGARAALSPPMPRNGNGKHNPRGTPSLASFSESGLPAYVSSLKAPMAAVLGSNDYNGISHNGHNGSSHQTNAKPPGQFRFNGNSPGRIILARNSPQVRLKTKFLEVVPSYLASLKFDTWNPEGNPVVQSQFNIYGTVNQNEANDINKRWRNDQDDGLNFGYQYGQQFNLVYNIDQGGTEGAQQGQGARPRGLIDWRLQAADTFIKNTIDHLTQIYNDRGKYNLTPDQIRAVAVNIHNLVQLRYAWGTMTADDVFIWRKVSRNGMTVEGAREALRKLKEYGLSPENFIGLSTAEGDEEARQVAKRSGIPEKQQDEVVALATGPRTLSPMSPYIAQIGMTTLGGDTPLLSMQERLNLWFVSEFGEIVDAFFEGEICIVCAFEETTSLIEEYEYYLHGGIKTSLQVIYSDSNGVGRDDNVWGGRLGGIVTQGGFGWMRDYPVIEGQNSIGAPVWSYPRFVASGPCIKGPGSVVQDDEWAGLFQFGVRVNFSPPKRIGISAQSYLYGVSGGELGGLIPCGDVTIEQEFVPWGLDVIPNDPHFAKKGSWGQGYADQWALQRIGFKALEDKTSAWHVTTGTERPVVVAVIDSGIDLTHPDLHINNIWFNEKEIPGNGRDDDGNGYIDDLIGWNFVYNHNNPFDLVGHGTHVAGIIAARWNNGRGIAGINRGARIMVLKAFNEVGKGWGSNVARAIVYAVDNGAQIINISASHVGHAKFMEHVFNYAKQKGVLVVVSAGNKGVDTKGVEAPNQPGTLVVAATLPDDKRAGFSNWGQEVDVAAPGVDVLSLRATRTDLIRGIAEDPSKVKAGEAVVGRDKSYYRAGGTSFATPLVSGLASLMWAKNPKLTAVQVARMIRQSANDIETPGWDQFTGYGLVDARGALTADPNWYLVAKIHALQGVMKDGQPVVQVVGTVEGSSVAGYEVHVGEGKEPKEWRTVAKRPALKVVGGVMARLKPADFGGPGTWTVRIVARDKGGRTRESRGVLNIN